MFRKTDCNGVTLRVLFDAIDGVPEMAPLLDSFTDGAEGGVFQRIEFVIGQVPDRSAFHGTRALEIALLVNRIATDCVALKRCKNVFVEIRVVPRILLL